jgi:hypothetical protein
MPITPWLHYADHPLASICRSRPGSNMPVGDRGGGAGRQERLTQSPKAATAGKYSRVSPPVDAEVLVSWEFNRVDRRIDVEVYRKSTDRRHGEQ